MEEKKTPKKRKSVITKRSLSNAYSLGFKDGYETACEHNRSRLMEAIFMMDRKDLSEQDKKVIEDAFS